MKKPSFYGRFGFAILMVIAFMAPLMLGGTRRAMLSNKNDVKAWLPEGYEETNTFEWYRAHFPSDMFILASWEGCTLDSPQLPLMAKKLVQPEDPNWTPTNAKPRFFRSALTGNDLLNALEEREGLSREEAIGRLKGFVIGKDGKQTCLVLSVAQDSEALWDIERAKHQRPMYQAIVDRICGRPQSAEEKFYDRKFLHAVVEEVQQAAAQCAIRPEQLHLGGPPVDNVAIDIEGEKSLMRLAGVSALVGLFMSWWCLRSWSLTAMVFSSAIFTAGLSLAAVWYTGTSMNAILLTMPSLVYVAAASGAIHLANYYRDTVRQHGFEGAPDRAAGEAWLPLALATGTTAVGLASMCITDLVPIRLFGLYSAIGVVISFFVVIFYVPAVLQFFPLRNIAKPRAENALFDPGLSPKWRGVGLFVIRHNRLVLAGCVIFMAVGAWGLTRAHTSVKLMRMFSPEARIIQDYAWLEEHLGALVPMEVVVRIDNEKCKLDTLQRMMLVSQVQQAVSTLPDVGNALAAPTFAPNLPRRPNFIERRTWIVQLNKHREDLSEYLKTSGHEELWRVSGRVAALTSVDYGEFINDIRGVVEPVLDTYRSKGIEGIQATYTGLVPLIYRAQSSMLDGLILNFAGDLALIGIAMILLLRNFSAGFLLMLPSLFPLACVFGAMGWLGVVIDVGTVMVPAVALGVTVDDAIHFMLWCRHGQERGMNREESIMFAYQDCARAIYQSWGVIGLGLAAFSLSSFTPTQRFGYLMFTMLTVSSIGNLVMLPALLAGPFGHFFWRTRKGKKSHAAPEELAATQAADLDAADRPATIAAVSPTTALAARPAAAATAQLAELELDDAADPRRPEGETLRPAAFHSTDPAHESIIRRHDRAHQYRTPRGKAS